MAPSTETHPSSSSPSQPGLRLDNGDYRELLDAMPSKLLLLDEEGRVTYANKAFSLFTGRPGQELLGGRPGDALSCLHALESSTGCMGTEYCSMCNLRRSLGQEILSTQQTECRILQRAEVAGRALDLRVWITPVLLGQTRYQLLTIEDIAPEKRRDVLERIFFHDVLNTAGVLQSFVSMLRLDSETMQNRDLLAMLERSVGDLVEEINAQRQLIDAERQEIEVKPTWIQAPQILSEMAENYNDHQLAGEKTIALGKQLAETTLYTDPRLLRRVLGNLIKNALEATAKGEQVTLDCARRGEQVQFSVHNRETIPREVQLQIFQRSFSTKGENRGVGTYSVKLITEGYLDGAVSFDSTDSSGTFFYVTLPVMLRPKERSKRFPSDMGMGPASETGSQPSSPA